MGTHLGQQLKQNKSQRMTNSGKKEFEKFDAEKTPYSLNRAAIVRIFHIHYRLQAGVFPNKRTLSEELEISEETIKRDIECMRNDLHFPMDYNDKEHGWYYTEKMDKFPVITLTSKDMFGLFMLDELLKQYEGTPLYAPLRMLLDKVVDFVSPNARFSLDNFETVASWRPVAGNEVDFKKFETIQYAIENQRVVKTMYRRHNSREEYERYLMPYCWALVDYRWYVLADAPGRGKVHTYVLPRISNPEITKDTFEKPPGWTPNEVLGGAFRAMGGTEKHNIVIDFDTWSTDIVCDRKWHPTQKFEIREDGTSRMTMQIDSLEEVKCFLMGHIDHFEVIEPAALNAEIDCAVLRMARKRGLMPAAPDEGNVA
ncbi:MAG: hypothetical protein JWM68_1086 [Verrucomicrobiales bacterium]|nr:hypothetical protein [Verrucomicrobiales bacterium]